MTETDAAVLRKALDLAIAELAASEYDHLSDGMSLAVKTQSVDSALNSLMALQQAREPAYDSEWVSLFYLTWFQPRQIHLAYSALQGLLAETSSPRHVIDYGCGAWAVQFALAILNAERREPADPGVAVYGIDSNEPMREIGRRLWNRFGQIVAASTGEHPFFERLHDALDSIEATSSCHASYDEALQRCDLLGQRLADCWFTAVHAIYETNSTDMKSVLGGVCEKQVPVHELATFRKASSPMYFWGGYPNWKPFFAELGFSEAELNVAWTGTFAHVTRWRKNLPETLPDLQWRRKRLLQKHDITWDPLGRLAAGDDVVMIRSRAQ